MSNKIRGRYIHYLKLSAVTHELIISFFFLGLEKLFIQTWDVLLTRSDLNSFNRKPVKVDCLIAQFMQLRRLQRQTKPS